MPVDRYGDPLPLGALSRIGTVRFRQSAPSTALAFSPDGKSFASAGQDAVCRVWDVSTGKEQRQFGIYEGATTAMAWSPSGKLLVTGGHDGNISFWDPQTGRDLNQVRGHQGPVLALTFTADGDTLISGGADNIVRLWDPNSCQELGQFTESFGTFEVVAIGPDSTTLALGSWESTIRLCDVASSKELRGFRGPRVGVKAMAFSPDARTLATASVDGSVSIWELMTGKERKQFPKHLDGAFALAFSADGRMLASSGADTTVLIWDVYNLILEKPASAAPLPVQVPPLWDDLASDDPIKAFKAMCALASAPKVTLPSLKDKLQKLAPIEPLQISRFIGDLNNPQFAIRERATQDLEKYGPLVEPELKKALEARPGLEVRKRLEKMLEKMNELVPTAAMQQALRGIETLEAMNTGESRQVLEQLGRSTPETRFTREAQVARQRLG
jgi:hypothetical protein